MTCPTLTGSSEQEAPAALSDPFLLPPRTPGCGPPPRDLGRLLQSSRYSAIPGGFGARTECTKKPMDALDGIFATRQGA
jgi:hypothetical protein